MIFAKVLSFNVFISLLLSAISFGIIYIGLSLLFKLDTMKFVLLLIKKKQINEFNGNALKQLIWSRKRISIFDRKTE